MAWGEAWQNSGLVFTREDGPPLRPGHICEHFGMLVGRAGLPPVRFHDLRHGAATLSLAAGVTSRSSQEMLGHATSSFTRDVYTSVVPEIATAAAEAVAAIVPRRARTGRRDEPDHPARASNVPARARYDPVMPDAGSAAEASRYLVFAQVAEADGNRTRQRRSAALTSFEDWGDHQAPRRLRVDSDGNGLATPPGVAPRIPRRAHS